MTASRKRDVVAGASTDKSDYYNYNYLEESRLRHVLFYWHRSCLSSLNMAIKQNTSRSADCILPDENSASRNRKSAKHSPARKLEERRNGPLNVLGCLALIHAIRSVNSAKEHQVCSGRAMVA
jgi:hypothetical protein